MMMNRKPSKSEDEWLTGILQNVKTGKLSIAHAIKELSVLPYEEMNYAKVDHHRNFRVGFPEVIFGSGKTISQIASIAVAMSSRSKRILITHALPKAFNAVKTKIPDATYNPVSKTIVVNRTHPKLRPGITIVTAGTADIPVAEEAAVTAELMGNKVAKIFDIGIAGIHRMFDNLPQLRQARVIIVVAGMEGALPGVICGLVAVPVIAVPTSIGYGAGFAGLAPLLTMLNSCAPGIAVVNIDNGFGAGYLAGLINQGSNLTDENGK